MSHTRYPQNSDCDRCLAGHRSRSGENFPDRRYNVVAISRSITKSRRVQSIRQTRISWRKKKKGAELTIDTRKKRQAFANHVTV